MSTRTGSYLSLDPGGFHRVAYREYGAPDAERVVVCVHGLTRNSADFDTFARALSDACRLVCVDVVGRGASDWLRRGEDYGYPLYCSDLAALLAHLGLEEVDWVGTSMGGLIGMMLAAQPGTPLRKLVLNDIGPFVPAAALELIVERANRGLSFDSLEALDAYMAENYATFGPFTEEQWRDFVRASARETPEGKVALAYDPAIGTTLASAPVADVDLWALYDRVEAPTLVLRGTCSDVLLEETAEEMTRRGPRARLVLADGIGHAPTLNGDDQIAALREFLLG